MTTPWGEVGYITYKRTYARKFHPNKSETEEFEDTVARVIKATQDQLKCGFTPEEESHLQNYMLSLKGLVAGRFLWQLGTTTVDRLGLMSLQNCAGCVIDHPWEPFCWTFDALMLGSGVGFNVQREFVYELPKPKKVTITRLDTKDADFIVPDSREGWVELLRRVLTSHFSTGKGFTYSTICIRGKGTPIKSFGGEASGPEELCYGINEISKLLNSRAGKKIRSVDALDIQNIIAFIVVSGNVRRSAQLSVGDCDDLLFLNAKRWDLGNIPNWRAMSNNSVVCNDISQLPEQFWSGYDGNGEPYGLINLKLARECGRTGETQYPDKNIVIFNPCVEQSLEKYETCALATLFLPNFKTQEEFFDCLQLLYRVVKHSLLLPCHDEKTEEVVHKNMRMGLSVTGTMQATEEQLSWLSPCYVRLREFDKQYSNKLGCPISIKLTTEQPSGTLSLLAGTTPGCHPGYAQYFIRRIRIATNSDLVGRARDSGYFIEPVRNFDSTFDPNTSVVEFPCSYPEGTKLAKAVSAIDQLEHIAWLQANWSDNGVSCTVYYRKEELPGIRSWLLLNYNTRIKAVSFLLHSEHGFVQAPYEEITKERYEELKAKTKPISSVRILETDFDVAGCENGACPIK